MTQISLTDVYGVIKSGYEVEQAVMETLCLWMPTVICEKELQLGRPIGEIPPPRYYARPRFESFPTDWHPMVVVVCPGLWEQPLAEGDGVYRAWFTVGVGCTAIGRDDDVADFLSKLYVSCARWIMLNQPGMRDENGNHRASGVEWMDETYDDAVVFEEDKAIKAAYGVFRVLVEDVIMRGTGPLVTPPDPNTDPGTRWPTAQIVEVEVVI